MALEALFFDVGRTLLTEEPSRFEIYAEAARSRGHDLTEDAMKRVMRTANQEVAASDGGAYRYTDAWFRTYIHRIFCQDLGLPPQVLDELTNELLERFSNPTTFRIFPGAHELLGELKEHGLKLGVISNWGERLVALLERCELRSYFDVVLCSAAEKMEKPNPDLFHLALERVGASAANAVHIGDHPVEDGGAQAIGMDYVMLDHFAQSQPSTADGFAIVRSFEDLRIHLSNHLDQ
ncbi:MAG: REG-2-like HAD superfamily hydrolase [Planctomycetota bacterium]|jgi:REG-2-like HAD superfamily hydrolase